MSDLLARIRAEIATRGPMRLDRFWNLALFDAQGGYYTKRDPFGADGDFTTAPDISQMFGELLAAWCFAAWDGLGRPSPFVLAEVGPGRGTLMADMLRSFRQFDPAFGRAVRTRLVETSDRLTEIQRQRLARFDLPIRWCRRVEDLEALPMIFVANELLDAVAIRQLRFADGAWRERTVVTEGDSLALAEGPPLRQVPAVLARLPAPRRGDIFEWSPERDALCLALAERIGANGGAALLIDYGHTRTGFGDTLQALRRHEYAPLLERPGEADLTSHVDFERVGALFAGVPRLHRALATQGEFLLAMGLVERAGRLGREGDAAAQAAISAAVHRLAGNAAGQMGVLFKVFAASSAPLRLPPFPCDPSD
ncbi:SAM-dependent methyltransferase [Aureimonas sp. ME7]|uniref:class I SAM-dependent methyltransferase n=1 Tax=Aureimonas sp. ME7 TaxID=2744252 RepID=UPI001FCEA9B0|nr:SAM-dependent methyltransferase [Aureimonas sp. ME7]